MIIVTRVQRSVQKLFDTKSQNGKDAVAENLRKILNRCPICSENFTGHFYQLIATLPIKEGYENKAKDLLHYIDNHDWQSLLKFDEWEPTMDDYETFAVRCLNDEIVILTLISYYELFYSDDVINTEILNYEEGQNLLRLLDQNKWKLIDN